MMQNSRKSFCRLFFVCFFHEVFAMPRLEKGVNKD
jgi:hypothetical protein